MLVSFSVGNYLSFKNIQTLNLVADSFKEYNENLHTPYLFSQEDRVLKSIAIYGHNSNGKSNFIKSFQFFKQLVFNSFSLGQSQNSIPIEPFKLNVTMLDKPSYFEIIFLVKETKYRYRVQITRNSILEECLYYAEPKIRENAVFERFGQEIKISKIWNKDMAGKPEQMKSFAKPHILFLSILLSQEGINRIDSIGKWLNANLIIPDNYLEELARAKEIYSDQKYRDIILKFIDNADLGFKTIFDKIDQISKAKSYEKGMLNLLYDKEIYNFELYTKHDVFDANNHLIDSIEFELIKNESAGTIKYFIVVCYLSYAIRNSYRIWIDELDSRFHSDLLEMLVLSYHNPKINPIESQLIFTVHNTSIMDKKLRRDQMVLVDKDKYGESFLLKIHSSKKPLRIDKSIEREYRKGKLGGFSKKVKDYNLTLFPFEEENQGT